MPVADGFYLLRKIKSAWPDLPVVIFTGKAREGMSDEAMQLGAFDFIEKPVGVHELKDVIESCLDVSLRPVPAAMPPLMEQKKDAPRPQWRTALPAAVEKDMIIDALNQTHWNRSKAARLLGVGYSTFRRRLKALRIE